MRMKKEIQKQRTESPVVYSDGHELHSSLYQIPTGFAFENDRILEWRLAKMYVHPYLERRTRDGMKHVTNRIDSRLNIVRSKIQPCHTSRETFLSGLDYLGLSERSYWLTDEI